MTSEICISEVPRQDSAKADLQLRLFLPADETNGTNILHWLNKPYLDLNDSVLT